MNRYEVREREPSELQRELGVTGKVFYVWDNRWAAEVPRSECRTREQAYRRIDRMEKA